MDKHDKINDYVRLDSLKMLMEKGNSELGIEYVQEIRLGIPDMNNLTKWKTFIAPYTLNENLTWSIDDKLHFSFAIAPYNQVISITFKVKSLKEAERYLTENKMLFTLEGGIIQINPAHSFGLLIFFQ